jgi:S1-C subfamily serine protease
MSLPGAHVWRCPSCARQVPLRIEECRCGTARAVVTGPEEPEGANAEAGLQIQPEPSGTGTRTLLVGLLLGLGIAGLGFSWLQPTEPTSNATVASAQPNPIVESGDWERQVEPEEVVNRIADSPAVTQPETRRRAELRPSEPSARSSSSAASLEDVVARVLPSVVSIQAGSGRGTGFFVRSDFVLTNAHVVGNETSVRLQSGSKQYQGRVVRLSPGTDLALVQVYNSDPQQPSLSLGSAQGVRAGQEVIAIGFALGVLSNTVTRGIVSAVRDTGTVRLIQTDAAINPGNSGGPLVNRDGVVVGVNSMRIAGTQGGEGLAFAVAIDHGTQLLRGDSSTAATATPVQGLNRMMTGASETSEMRDQGEKAYRHTLEQAVRSGNELDTYWERYAKSCVLTATRAGDRQWFAVLEPNGVRITATSAYDCEAWLGELRTAAAAIRTALTDAAEAARRQGVYPGVMRDLRRQYRMEWAGWER